MPRHQATPCSRYVGNAKSARADLRGLLPEQLGPDAELAVPLQRRGLGVDAPGQHHVAVEAADRRRVLLCRQADAEGEVGMLDPLPLGGQELDQVRASVGCVRPEHLADVGSEVCGVAHEYSFVSTGARGLRCRQPVRGVTTVA
jgi:hypothetical protein